MNNIFDTIIGFAPEHITSQTENFRCNFCTLKIMAENTIDSFQGEEREKKEWRTTPKPIPKVEGPNVQLQLKQERHKIRQLNFVPTEFTSELRTYDLPQHMTLNRQQRAHNIKGYLRRVNKENDRSKLTVGAEGTQPIIAHSFTLTQPKNKNNQNLIQKPLKVDLLAKPSFRLLNRNNTSPALIPGPMPVGERLELFNKRDKHRCKHGNRYSNLVEYTDELGTYFYEPACECDKISMDLPIPSHKFCVCGLNYAQIESSCRCELYHCFKCKRFLYECDDIKSNFCLCRPAPTVNKGELNTQDFFFKNKKKFGIVKKTFTQDQNKVKINLSFAQAAAPKIDPVIVTFDEDSDDDDDIEDLAEWMRNHVITKAPRPKAQSGETKDTWQEDQPDIVKDAHIELFGFLPILHVEYQWGKKEQIIFDGPGQERFNNEHPNRVIIREFLSKPITASHLPVLTVHQWPVQPKSLITERENGKIYCTFKFEGDEKNVYAFDTEGEYRRFKKTFEFKSFVKCLKEGTTSNIEIRSKAQSGEEKPADLSDKPSTSEQANKQQQNLQTEDGKKNSRKKYLPFERLRDSWKDSDTKLKKVVTALTVPIRIADIAATAIKDQLGRLYAKLKAKIEQYLQDKIMTRLEKQYPKLFKFMNYIKNILDFLKSLLNIPIHKFVNVAGAVQDLFGSTSFLDVVKGISGLYGALYGTPAYTMLLWTLGIREDMMKIMSKMTEQEIEFLAKHGAVIDGFDMKVLASMLNKKAQSGAFTSYVSDIGGLFGLGGKKLLTFIQLMSKKAKDFNATYTMCKNFGDILGLAIKLLPACIKRYFTVQTPDLYLRQQFKDKESNLVKLVKAAHVYHNAKYMTADPIVLTQYQKEALDAYRKVNDELLEIGMTDQTSKLMTYLGRQCRQSPQSYIGTEAIEPFVVTLAGEPGVGKSTFADYVVAKLLGYDADEVRQHTYYRNSCDPYWSGFKYAQHEAVIFDDFGQDTVEYKDIKELISLVSIASFLPPMPTLDDAEIGQKGTVVAPRVIVLCTNLESVDSVKGIHHLGAVSRRFGQVYKLSKITEPVNLVAQQTKIASVKVKAYEDDFRNVRFEQIMTLGATFTFENYGDMLEDLANKFDTFLDVKDKIKDGRKRNMPKLLSQKDLARRKRLDMAKHKEEDEDEEMPAKAQSVDNEFASLICASIGAIMPYGLLLNVLASGPKWVSYLLLGITAIFSMAAMFFCIKEYMTTTSQSKTGGFKRVTRMKAQDHWLSFEPDDTPEAQASDTSNIPEIVYNNFIELTYRLKIGNNRRNKALFISGAVFMTNKHFFIEHDGELLANETQLNIKSYNTTANTTEYIFFNRENLIEIPDSDLCLYNCGHRNVSPRRTITHLFNENPAIFPNTPIVAALWRQNKLQWYNSNIKKVHHTFDYDSAHGKPIYVNEAVSYDLQTTDGDCGTPIILNTKQPTIIAIHCAGNAISAYGVLITRKTITKYLDKFKIKPLEEPTIPMIPIAAQDCIEKFGFAEHHSQILGVVPKILVPSNGKTSILESPYAGCLGEQKFAPASLDPKLTILGINKYSGNVERMDQDKLQLIADDLVTLYTSYYSPTPWRKLTVDEVLNGVPGCKYLRPLDYTTSAGAPFNIMGIRGEKRKLFELKPNTEHEYQPGPLLAKILEQYTEKIERGVIPFVPFTDTLKDETRLLEKVNKPRLFAQASLLSTIVMKQYFGSFMAHMTHGRIYNECAIGLNPYSREYDLLIKYLLEVGGPDDENFGSSDVDKWDGRMILDAMWVFTDVTNRVYEYFMTDHRTLAFDNECRETLSCVGTFALHMATVVDVRTNEFFTIFWIARGGEPSGYADTIYKNSMINQVYNRYAWLVLAPTLMRDLYFYKKNVRAQYCGDDNINNKSRACMPFYNTQTIAACLAKYGVLMVNASDKNLPPVDTNLYSASFIQLLPRKEHGTYLPMLNEDTIYNIINWYKKTIGPEIAFEVNANTILRFQYFYGREQFNKTKAILHEVKPSVELLSYGTLHEQFMELGYIVDEDNFHHTQNDSLLAPIRIQEKSIKNMVQPEKLNDFNPTMIKAQSATEIIDDTIDTIQKSIMPIETMIDAFAGLLDKPAMTDNVKPVFIRNGQFHGHSRGAEMNIDNLGVLDPAAMQLVDAEHTSCRVDEMLIKNLIKKKCLLTTINWKTSQTEGTLLGSFIVSPTHNTPTIPAGGHAIFPLLASIAQVFDFWRGGIKFTLEFVCSNWQEGRVDMTYQPNQTVASTGYKAALSQYAISYTIRNGRNLIELDCPYIAVQPWRRVWRNDPLKDDPTDDYFKASDFLSGVFGIYVSVPLKAPATVVNNMDINVYVSASDDFELSYNSFGGISRPFVLYPTTDEKLERQRSRARPIAQSGEQSSISENQLNLRQVGGVGLLEQNQPIVVDRSSTDVFNARAHLENQDMSWNLPQMLSRKNLVGSVSWALSDTPNTILTLNGTTVTDVISDLLQNDIISVPFNRFSFWRCKYVDIHVQLTASRYHQGRLLMAYVPSQIPKALSLERITAARVIANDHVMLDPANGTVATLRIPYKHFKGYLDLKNNDSLGQLYFVVLNQLQAVTGSAPTVTVKVFVSVVGSEFTTPRPGGASFLEGLAAERAHAQSTNDAVGVTSADQITQEVETSVVEELPAPTPNTSSKPKPTVAATQRATPHKTLKPGISKVIDPNKVSILGDNKANFATLAPKDMYTADPKNPHFGETYRSLRETCKRYIPVSRHVFDSAWIGAHFSPDAQLGIEPFQLTIRSGDFIFGHLGMMSFCAHMFRNWRGSINFKVFVRVSTAAGYRPQVGSIQIINDQIPYIDDRAYPRTAFYGTLYNNGARVDNQYDTGVSSAIAYGDFNQWIEFKLPFLTEHSSKLLSQAETQGLFSNNYFGFPSFRILTTTNTSEVLGLDYSVYASFGDETRMWNFYMIPWTTQLQNASGKALYPDGWSTTLDDKNDEDDEIVVIHTVKSKKQIK